MSKSSPPRVRRREAALRSGFHTAISLSSARGEQPVASICARPRRARETRERAATRGGRKDATRRDAMRRGGGGRRRGTHVDAVVRADLRVREPRELAERVEPIGDMHHAAGLSRRTPARHGTCSEWLRGEILVVVAHHITRRGVESLPGVLRHQASFHTTHSRALPLLGAHRPSGHRHLTSTTPARPAGSSGESTIATTRTPPSKNEYLPGAKERRRDRRRRPERGAMG